MKKITATVQFCDQVGVDSWKQKYHSKTFELTTTIEEILLWARSFQSPIIEERYKFTINDIIFSESDN